MLCRAILAPTVLLALLVAGPVSAGKIFTVDYESGLGGPPGFTGDDVNDLDGTDDLPFNFTKPSLGTFDGLVRATDVLAPFAALTADLANVTNLSGTGTAFSFAAFDVLIVDIVLSNPSATVDEVRIGVGTDPLGIDPDYAGWFQRCDGATVTVGCRNAVPAADSEDPTGVFLVDATPPSGPFPGFPGAAQFFFNTLDQGETSVRLFVAWEDTGDQTPLSKVGQTAKFMIGAQGVGDDWEVAIVPEPGTAVLLGLALTVLAGVRARRLG